MRSKTRIALGLAPLADPSATGEDGAAAPAPTEEETAVENYQREKAARDADKQSREARERLEKTRNQRELKAKLSGKGLGEEEDNKDDDSAKNWVKKSKKRAKSVAADLARRRAEEQAQMDAELQAAYGEDDLAGLRVGHSAQDFEDGEETVLTLKDSRINADQKQGEEEEEDDELVNVSLAERERTQDRLRLTKEGKQAGKYNPYADDDAEFANPGQRRGILSKYDADIPDAQEGSHTEGFTLGKVSRARDGHQASEGAAFKAVDMPVQKNAEARKQVAQQLGQTLSADLNYESMCSYLLFLDAPNSQFSLPCRKSRQQRLCPRGRCRLQEGQGSYCSLSSASKI